MLRLRKGDEVTPATMNSFFLELYKRMNAIDPSQMVSLTTGQFLSQDDVAYSVPLNTSSEQFLLSEDVTVELGKLYDDITEIIGE